VVVSFVVDDCDPSFLLELHAATIIIAVQKSPNFLIVILTFLAKNKIYSLM
jgi:hypothetical protein